MTSVGAYIQTGSRYETAETAGINSFIESMAFGSTQARSDFRLVREMLGMGINVSCQSGREFMAYHGDCMREYSPEVVATIADVIQVKHKKKETLFSFNVIFLLIEEKSLLY